MNTINRIRLIRKTLNLRQGEFAQQVGLTQTALSMIELEKVALTEKNIKLICATFAVDENWLRTGKGEMFGPSSPYEKELLAVFGKLTADTQEFVLEMARNLLKRQEKPRRSKKNSPIVKRVFVVLVKKSVCPFQNSPTVKRVFAFGCKKNRKNEISPKP